jgi:ABC-type amino acid transport substrate-binding protein
MRTGKIRAAYVIYPPGCSKDPNTGKIYGISVETLEAAATNLNLKLEWTEEVGWGTMIEGLKTDRYDIVSSGIWPSSSRSKQVDFCTPLFYSGIGVYVRTNEERFSISDLKEINQDTVKIATIDGEMSDIIARSQFTKAQRVSVPQLSDVSQILLNVIQKKADVAFVEPYIAYRFLENNPGTVKNIAAGRPIRVFPNTMMFKRNQMEFKTMLNITLTELINSGFVNGLVDKYEPAPGLLNRVALPYQPLEK